MRKSWANNRVCTYIHNDIEGIVTQFVHCYCGIRLNYAPAVSLIKTLISTKQVRNFNYGLSFQRLEST